MSFHDDLKEAWGKGIYLAVKEECKMEPVRVDFVEHKKKICDEIVAEICTCQFLVADVTLQRAGVYFEAGFSLNAQTVAMRYLASNSLRLVQALPNRPLLKSSELELLGRKVGQEAKTFPKKEFVPGFSTRRVRDLLTFLSRRE